MRPEGAWVITLFAVLGVYLFPLWLPLREIPVGDLVVYFAAWSLVFAAAALQEGRRLTYRRIGQLAA